MIRDILKCKKFRYFLGSFHREENLDNEHNLRDFFNLLNYLKSAFKLPIIVSTHFRLNKKLQNQITKYSLKDRYHSYINFLVCSLYRTL